MNSESREIKVCLTTLLIVRNTLC